MTTSWLSDNYIELSGALLGLAYIILSIRQNILTWPAGLLSSLLYIVVFFNAKIYAAMGLQVYYVGMSFYGWYFWLMGRKEEPAGKVPVTNLTGRQGMIISMVALPIFGLIFLLLRRFTDSPVPFMDSLISTLGIMGTWMLARKILLTGSSGSFRTCAPPFFTCQEDCGRQPSFTWFTSHWPYTDMSPGNAACLSRDEGIEET